MKKLVDFGKKIFVRAQIEMTREEGQGGAEYLLLLVAFVIVVAFVVYAFGGVVAKVPKIFP